MGQLIGLAVLFYVIVVVCKKYFSGQPKMLESQMEDEVQEQIQAAYRDGFNDGVRYAEDKHNDKKHTQTAEKTDD